MSKKTLNIAALCVFVLIISFSITQKNKSNKDLSDNIIVDKNGQIKTKADQYKSNILETISQENEKNFKKFANTFEKNSNDNITDSLSKDVFSQYIKYNTYGEIKEDDIANITQNVLKNKVELENPTTYSEIKTSASTKDNLKNYGNNMAIIIDSINKGILSIENKKDKTPYLANIYRTAAKLFKQVDVPIGLAENHMMMINGYTKYAEGLDLLQYQNSDPAKALLGLTKMKSAADEVTNGFDKIKKTIILNKVTYTENEDGIIWTKYNE